LLYQDLGVLNSTRLCKKICRWDIPAWLPISYPGNNGTGQFSYQLETAQLPFRVRITSWELHRGTANELPNGKEGFPVSLGFPVSKSKCWDGSQDSKLPLHASNVAFPT